DQRPRIAGLSGGGYALTWYEADASGHYHVFSAAFDSQGHQVAAPLSFNNPDGLSDVTPRITGLPGDGYALSWERQTADSFSDIYTAVLQTENHAPTITSDGAGDMAAVSVAENSVVVTTASATDADAGQVLAFSIAGGADAEFFAIDSVTGQL